MQSISASVAIYEKKEKDAKRKNTFRQSVSRLHSFQSADNDFLRHKRTADGTGARRGGDEARDVISAFIFDFI